jgi:hypothetical protein
MNYVHCWIDNEPFKKQSLIEKVRLRNNLGASMYNRQ